MCVKYACTAKCVLVFFRKSRRRKIEGEERRVLQNHAAVGFYKGLMHMLYTYSKWHVPFQHKKEH